MKKAITMFMAFCLLAVYVLQPAAAEAASESTGNRFRVTESGIQHILEHKNAAFSVMMKLVSDMKVDITYSYDDWTTVHTHTADVKGRVWTEEKISLTHLPKGVYRNFQVRVQCGKTILHEVTLGFAIIDFYEKHPMDAYTTLGINSYYSTGNNPLRNEPELNLLDMLGIRKTRPGWLFSWDSIEANRKGEYEWEKRDNNVFSRMRDGKLSIYFTTSGSNSLYNCERHPLTPEQVEGYCKYVKNALETYGDMIHAIEVENEPNLRQFWNVDDSYGEAYVTLVKAVYQTVKAYDPDMPVVAGVVSDSGKTRLNQFYDRNMAWYVDAVSFHPYIGASDPDGGFGSVMQGFADCARDRGDWLDVYISEMGWASVEGTSTTQEKIGEYHIKGQVESDAQGNEEFIFYELTNQGSSPTSREDQYGFSTFYGESPKDGLSIAANTYSQLNTARFIGRFYPQENCVINVYLREGKPLVVAWCTKTDETADYTFEGDNLLVQDYNGNPVETGNTVTLQRQPCFITGLSNAIVDTAAKEFTLAKTKAFIEAYSELGATAGVESLQKQISATSIFTEHKLDQLLAACYGCGDALLNAYNESTGYSVEKLGLMLNDLQEIAKPIALLYGKFDKTAPSVSKGYIENLRKQSLALCNGDQAAGQPLTRKMIYRANKFARRADDEAKIAGYKGMAKADSVMAKYICGWAEKFMQLEPVNEAMGLIAYTDTRTISVYQEAAREINITIDNRLQRDVSGYIVVTDNEGHQFGEKLEGLTLPAGQLTQITVPVVIGKNAKVGTECTHIQFIEENKVMTDQAVATTILSPCNVKLLPSSVPYDKLTHIDVSMENTADYTIDATVNVQAPEGWSLKETAQDIQVTPGETKTLSFEVTQKTPTAFNEYSFAISAKEKNGKELADALAALDFAVVVKADKAIDLNSFSGDISDWANAYPIHAGTPQTGSSAADWQNSNVASRILAKWDERYLYVLCDVYDNYQVQLFSGGVMWQGDSVQLAFDPLVNGLRADGSIIEGYQSDDTELTFGKTSSGVDEAYAGTAAEGTAAGSRENYVKIIRNDAEHITRYLIRIPAEEIALKLGMNEQFAYTAVVNDADTLNREQYIAVTRGLGDYKATGHYYTFTCLPSEKAKVSAAQSKDYVIRFSD